MEVEEQRITVDIIIPTYKRPRLLRNAIESALIQTYPYIQQIIVTDDACDLETRKIVEAFMLGDQRVFYVCNTKYLHGPAGNNNNGMDYVKSDYFLILDDDDLLVPNAVEEFVRATQNGKYDFVLANCLDSNGNYTGKHYGRDQQVSYEDFLCGKFDGEYLWLNRSQAIAELKFDDKIYAGEHISIWKALKNSKAFYLHLPLRHYNTEGQRVSGQEVKKADYWFQIYLKTLDNFGEDFSKYCPRRLLYFSLLLFFYGRLAGQTQQIKGFPKEYFRKTKNIAFLLPYVELVLPKPLLVYIWKNIRSHKAKRKQQYRTL